MNSLYKIPFRCQEIIDRRRQETCNLADSIRQHIHLIFRTHFREYRYNPEFGSLVWDKDFETIRSIYKWREELTQSFHAPLVNFEKRLTEINVNTKLDELKIIDPSTQKVVEVRKRITVGIEGVIVQTNDFFYHTEFIFFSPLSMI